jgi:hypothetical protein
MQNMLVNCLGGSRNEVEVDVHQVSLADGDRLLLCTDGLTDMVSNVEIGKILDDQPEPNPAARALVDLALDHGGKDNVTVVLARFTIERESQRGHRPVEPRYPSLWHSPRCRTFPVAARSPGRSIRLTFGRRCVSRSEDCDTTASSTSRRRETATEQQRTLVIPPTLARIIHVGWDEVAETIGGPSQANRLTNYTVL